MSVLYALIYYITVCVYIFLKISIILILEKIALVEIETIWPFSDHGNFYQGDWKFIVRSD